MRTSTEAKNTSVCNVARTTSNVLNCTVGNHMCTSWFSKGNQVRTGSERDELQAIASNQCVWVWLLSPEATDQAIELQVRSHWDRCGFRSNCDQQKHNRSSCRHSCPLHWPCCSSRGNRFRKSRSNDIIVSLFRNLLNGANRLTGNCKCNQCRWLSIATDDCIDWVGANQLRNKRSSACWLIRIDQDQAIH
jgi:hypothetical protein